MHLRAVSMLSFWTGRSFRVWKRFSTLSVSVVVSAEISLGPTSVFSYDYAIGPQNNKT